MSSTRLTFESRKAIRLAALNKMFRPRFDALVAKRAKLALDIFEFAFKDEIKIMKKLPEGFVPEINAIYAKFQGEQDYLPFSGAGRSWSDGSIFHDMLRQSALEDVWRRAPYEATKHNNNSASVKQHFTLDDEFAKRRAELQLEADKLKEEVSDASHKIHSTLETFQSVKKLVEAWPEVEELLPEKTPRPVTNLPAIVFEELNKMIGLPSKPVEGDVVPAAA